MGEGQQSATALYRFIFSRDYAHSARRTPFDPLKSLQILIKSLEKICFLCILFFYKTSLNRICNVSEKSLALKVGLLSFHDKDRRTT